MMEKLTKAYFLKVIVLGLLMGCNSEMGGFTSLETNLTEIESQIVGSWQYVQIETSGNTYQFADQVTEPGFGLRTSIGQRAEISRRIINYSADGLYQLRWTDRGQYQLGTEGEANWQPNFGNWYYDADKRQLVHNEGLYYSVAYTINTTGDSLIRTSQRVMSSERDLSMGRPWNKGDVVTFREIMVRLN